MTRTELAAAIFKSSYLRGEFKLRSGQTSNEYFDKYRFEAEPEILAEIAKKMTPLVPKGTQVLAGLEMGGIPIATALSMVTGLPVCFVRKEAKAYGTMKLAEGTDVAKKNVCIIEDVITTGGQVIESVKALRKAGAEIANVLCVIDREQGGRDKLQDVQLWLQPLFLMTELKASV
jgi:orotate phosphoribosyltransferase